MPKKEPKHYWNTLEMTNVLSAANTLTEVSANTGVAVGQKRIMLVKKIAVSYNLDLSPILAPGDDPAVFVVLATQQGLVALPALQDNETIYYHAAQIAGGGDGATAAETPAFFKTENGFPTYVEFDDPIPIADDEISLYFDSSLMNSALTAAIKIYYAIADVTLDEALTILESYR